MNKDPNVMHYGFLYGLARAGILLANQAPRGLLGGREHGGMGHLFRDPLPQARHPRARRVSGSEAEKETHRPTAVVLGVP